MKLRRPFLTRRVMALVLLLAVMGTLLLVRYCDRRVATQAAPFVYDRVEDIPANEVGLVLGTSERGRGGGANPYFQHRMEAAAMLYHAGKVRHLLVSGDNGRKDYNEPLDMRRALMAAGVDSTDITLDHAGFRTLDSVVRARKVFGQRGYTVISQRFHNERAIYIARQNGLAVVGFNARDVGMASGLRTQLREKLARVKVHVDELLGIAPHFLGEPVQLGENPGL